MTKKEKLQVDYDTLPDIEEQPKEIDYSALPDIEEEPQQQKKKEEESVSAVPFTGVKEPLVSAEEQQARLIPESSTIQPLSEVEIQFTEDQLARQVEKSDAIEENFAELSERTGVPVEMMKSAAGIITALPDTTPLDSHYSSAFARGLYMSIGQAVNTLAGAHTFVQGIMGLPTKVNPFKDIAGIFDPELFTQAPDDALGDALFSLGAILPDVAVVHYAMPNMAIQGLSRLTKGTVTQVPKFATWLAVKGGATEFQESEDIVQSVIEAGEGFKVGLYYQALGMTGAEVGNLVSKYLANEVMGTTADAAVTSFLFGVSGMVETGEYDARTFMSNAFIGLGFSVPKAKAAFERAAMKKTMASYFTSTPEMESMARQSPKTNRELRKEAIELRIEALKAPPGMERNGFLMKAAGLENMIGIRGTTEFIKNSPEALIEAVRNDKSLSQEAADYYIKKIQDTFLESNESIQKVKPEIQELNTLIKRGQEIDKMEISDTEKQVLKADIDVRTKELTDVIHKKLTTAGERFEVKEGKEPEKFKEVFTPEAEREFEFKEDLDAKKITLEERITELENIKKEKRFGEEEIRFKLLGFRKIKSKEIADELITEAKDEMKGIEAELERRTEAKEPAIEEGEIRIGRKAYPDKEAFLEDLKKFAEQEKIPGGISVPPEMYAEVNKALEGTKYDVGITLATSKVKGIKERLDKAKELWNEGKTKEADAIHKEILSEGENAIREIFADVPEVSTSIKKTKGSWFGEIEPTFELKITDKGDNFESIVRRVSFLGEEWKQDNVHLSIKESALPKGKKHGVPEKDGSVYEVDFDISFKKKITDEQFNEIAEAAKKVGLPGFALKAGGKGVNLYNISKFENYGEFRKKLKRFSGELDSRGIGGVAVPGVRRLWNIGEKENGATRTYEDIRSEFSQPKAVEGAKGVGEKVEALGPEQRGKAGKPPVREDGVRDLTEGERLEAGEKKGAEIKPEDAERTPILVKSGVNILGFELDNNAAINLWRKYMTAPGHLPKEVFDRWIKSQGKVREHLAEAHFRTNEFTKALKKEYGANPVGIPKVTEAESIKINEALTNLGKTKKQRKEALKDIPESLHEPLIKMRNHIDALSREFVRSGIVEGELAGIFEKNLGFYMTRTYKVHTDPKWTWEEIPEEVKNRAISWMRAEFPKMSEKEIDGALQNYLYSQDSPMNVLQKGKMGAKDLGIMKHRKDVPVELRDLLGEHQDAKYNYATSVSKMAELIERHKFLEDMKKEGKGKFLFAEPTGKFHAPIVKEGDYRYYPLSYVTRFKDSKTGEMVESRKSYHTTPEIAEAFQKFNESSPIHPLTQAYMKYLNVPTKYGKTILSPVTHARNYFANYMFHVANGRIYQKPTGAMAMAHKTMFQDVFTFSNPEFQSYLKRLVELNVIGESTRAGEVHDILKDANYLQDYIKRGDNLFKIAGKKTLKGTEKLYQLEDDVHKIVAFETEKSRYKPVIEKQNPKATPEEINRIAEEKAAEITRMTMPTYSLVPKLIREIRRVPLVGTFVSFPAEVIRTSFNTLDLAVKEMKHPDTRAIGIQRMAGVMTASLLTGAISTGVSHLNGVDRNDMQDIRRFVAPWSENSDLMVLRSKGNGVYTYVDVGFSDPFNYLKKPIVAMLNGEDIGDSSWDAVKQMVEPFLGEELLAGRLMDIQRNTKKDTKSPVYNPEDNLGDQTRDKWLYLWGGIQPGVIYTGKRLAKSFKRDVEERGGLDPRNELTNLFLGLRSNDLDVKKSMSFKLRRSGNRLSDAFDIYKKTFYDKGISAEDQQKALEAADISMEKIIDELHEDYMAAIRLGVNEDELDRMVKDMRVGPYGADKRVRRAILTGDFPGIDPVTGKLK